ncbi:MAG: ribose-phosphate pyrophosphokinase, ribose-phosphate pyrophosphokinase [Candidatus Gottesmanbacteria bacterium GW2011_GWA2_43_14]|uniref:ribose-phosphate diphosphokinase n=1 Tax=Candidatus Gottesmanbacteria bacterium GW2011_GWA2_43_14 TaxID=1618443 RepID=A0A0G1DIX3_9BACT|nr:MAG: ribose-phosphate pyrophosphokinase, ribose-phosphate pyrophosphokinase [Candidatus Gottesmanbacteria bacterium GW2011_GWA2_43_14]
MDSIIFSGNSNPELTAQITSELKIPLGKAEIIRFADSECRVRIEEDVEGKNIFVIQSLSNPVDEHLMEFLLMGDAVKRGEPRKMIAVLPYHSYARQDRIHRPGECLSAQVVAKMIESVGFDKLITLELHNESIVGFFKIPVVHVSGLEVFRKRVTDLKEDVVIITPDAGALKRSQKFAESLDLPLALIEKKRDLERPHKILSMRVVGDVKNRTAVIVDDVIVTGGTLINAAFLLKEKGAKKVIAAATHADFVGGADKILQDSPLDQVWVTDTIFIPPSKNFPKLKISSIASTLSGTMAKMVK